MHKLASSIYTKLSNEMKKYVIHKVNSLQKHTHLDHANFLLQVDSVWRAHCDHISTIRNIFLYLDRSYALPTHGIKSVWDLGCLLFLFLFLFLFHFHFHFHFHFDSHFPFLFFVFFFFISFFILLFFLMSSIRLFIDCACFVAIFVMYCLFIVYFEFHFYNFFSYLIFN